MWTHDLYRYQECKKRCTTQWSHGQSHLLQLLKSKSFLPPQLLPSCWNLVMTTETPHLVQDSTRTSCGCSLDLENRFFNNSTDYLLRTWVGSEQLLSLVLRRHGTITVLLDWANLSSQSTQRDQGCVLVCGIWVGQTRRICKSGLFN